MLLNSFNLILSIVIATCLVILQETMSNMFWLITLDMPVTIGIFLNTYFSNLFLMKLEEYQSLLLELILVDLEIMS